MIRIIEWLYPMTCVFCGKICKEGICDVCRVQIPKIEEPRCKRCGKPIHFAEEEFCYDCKNTRQWYEQGRSLWLHQGRVKQSLYAFKYQNRRVYGSVYGRELAEHFGTLLKLWEIDKIIPVPIHKNKRRVRGFNQAEIIAKELGKCTGIPVDTSLVIRTRDTTPQKEYGHSERRKNLKNAFEVTSKKEVYGKNFLIVDDIYTTGTTIQFISKTLIKAGCKKTYFLTISIGQGF